MIYHGKGRDTQIRAESFRRMVRPLLDRGVTRLIIESREGRDGLDRQVLVGQLRRYGENGFGYDHMPPHGDPLLWVADALAWCSSAGGPMAGTHRGDHHLAGRQSTLKQREARPLTVRRGAGLTS